MEEEKTEPTSKYKRWKWTAATLCLFGLFKNFQPSQPFFLDYALHHGNFSRDVFDDRILPVTTFSYAVGLLAVLLITDLLRYKIVIIQGALAIVLAWVLTIWYYHSVPIARLRQASYGFGIATNVAYHTYMYANVEKEKYQIVTSLSHAAAHAGIFFGGLTGQLLFTTHTLTLEEINFISFAAAAIAVLISFLLPPVRRPVFTYPECVFSKDFFSMPKDDGDKKKLIATKKSCKLGMRLKRAIPSGILDLKLAYKNKYLRKWSIWWGASMAVFLQVSLYAESLWKHIEEENHSDEHPHLLNGYVEASHGFLSSLLALTICFIRFPWERWGEWYLAIVSTLEAICLLIMAQTQNLYVAYGAYIAFQVFFNVIIIIATMEVAESVSEDSEAFIFGINTLLAVIIQLILAFTVSNKHGFTGTVRTEYIIYGVFELTLAVPFYYFALTERSIRWNLPQI